MGRQAALWVLSGALCACAAADTTVGWRVNGGSAFPKAAPPLHWSATSNVIWKTKLPQWSNASPILVGKRLFVCAEPDSLICVNRDTGAILWQHDNPRPETPDAGPKPPTQEVCGYTTPTPVSDGRTVFFLSGNGMAAAYGLDGKRKWLTLAGRPRQGWGHSASALLAGDRLFVVMEDEALALRTSDGSVLWKTNAVQAWGSPVRVPAPGGDLVFTAGGWAYSLAGGAIVAKLPRLEFNSPVVANGRLFCIEGGSKAYDPTPATNGAPGLAQAWSSGIVGDRYYSSPAVFDGLLYAVNQAGVFSVLDVKTGERKSERKLELGGTYYPSIAVAGGYVFVTSDNGKTLVLKPGPDPVPVATNQLEGVRSTPIFDGKRMYVRGLEHLYCISAAR